MFSRLLFLVCIAARIAAFAGVVRGPYLQNGAPTAVTIRWRTDTATASHAQAGAALENLDHPASDATPATEHEVRLTGLAPDTLYYYAIGDGVDFVEGPGAAWQFRTPPLPGAVKPVRIWALGDCGTGGLGFGAAEAVRDAYLQSPLYRSPDVWLMLGDNAYSVGADTEYQRAVFNTYRATLRTSILWSTLGNHETYTPGVPYFSIFTLPTAGEAGGLPSGTEHYYSFDYANIHFICLDSMQSLRTAGSPMLTWLTSDLAATTQRWIVAFWHHPPYTKGTHNSDFEIELYQMRQNALPILESYGVDLVLCGHSHVYERSYLLDGHYGYSWQLAPASLKDSGSGRADELDGAYGKDAAARQGAVYVVAGSSGSSGGGSLDHPAMFVSLSEAGSLVLDVEGDRIDAKFLNSRGVIRDYFTLIKAPLITITAPNPVMREGAGGPATVRLLRESDLDRALPLDIAIGGTATPGSDYALPLLPAVFPAGVSVLEVEFSAFTDTLAEGAETVSLALLPDAGHRVSKTAPCVTLTLADRPVDAWRFEKFGPQANDALLAGDSADPDGDGQRNLAEYLAGTEPRDAASRFAAAPGRDSAGKFVVRFLARKGRGYTVLWRAAFSTGAWQTLATVPPPASDQTIEIPDPAAAAAAQRFYQVVTSGPP